MRGEGDSNPDPGSVVLMCVEVLIRVSGKHALFQMDAWHVAASLRIPAALFQDFCQLKHSEAPISSHPSLVSNQVTDPLASMDVCVVDRYFSIDLFAACCRLLYTILKHHKRYGFCFCLSVSVSHTHKYTKNDTKNIKIRGLNPWCLSCNFVLKGF